MKKAEATAIPLPEFLKSKAQMEKIGNELHGVSHLCLFLW